MRAEVVGVISVSSRSQPGKMRTVAIWSDGRLTCDCPGYLIQGPPKNNPDYQCAHIKRVRQTVRVGEMISAFKRQQLGEVETRRESPASPVEQEPTRYQGRGERTLL